MDIYNFFACYVPNRRHENVFTKSEYVIAFPSNSCEQMANDYFYDLFLYFM